MISGSEGQRENEGTLSDERAWELLLYLSRRAAARDPVCTSTSLMWHHGAWRPSEDASASLQVDARRGVVVGPAELSGSVQQLLSLYLPLVVGASSQDLVLGHLGQSLDARVATPTGASQFITSREDIIHTHRLRALFDAVLVGANTVRRDDPQLTTRMVPGESPTRVVLDPSCRLRAAYRLFQDGAAPTLVFTAQPDPPPARGHVQWITVPAERGQLSLRAVLAALRERRLHRVFVEGGGVTVSRFLAARALRRLHVCVAPVILGSGAPSVSLPPIDLLDEALRFRCRHFSLGSDILFDCELDAAHA